ncbi:MAG: glycerol-3-phosphate 1-O-acyltransferase PlsY [Candidatus Cloacimonetes bacterium]|jgi:glycerol-3-phosphate acyltransferase PlsY|nr:glycerol-3-phosphate 1-O-acyltransferase PlsY [Candidatus Cloacimonadota bacterium]MDD2506821.1 glycerol-3-phosphate 1-O-acyltransferase PlsY [Candidatus Cloacimonadota bacterium]MDD4146994.1 glycerol-3-phosphate 1-O-acyltransferase PlsY [Candidatus Cloacimonadota bacterium]MDD4560021.1 glycerol-3-phosphate 1-O-acyltransferase PlsY [Candidatus Cloacimonadota bacterium]
MNAPEYLMLILAYFLGSIPIGLLVARIFYHRDIRKEGSGNIGATNALRQFGTKVGVFVLIMDMMKGVGAVLLARHFWGLAHPLVSVCGLLVILGHVFSIWLKFKGGKGVATAAGVFAALAPMSLIIAVLVFILVVVRSRYVSLGSILAAVVFAICTYLMELLSPKPDWGLLILTALIVLMIVFRHIENIKRLVKGEENKISFSKRGRS